MTVKNNIKFIYPQNGKAAGCCFLKNLKSVFSGYLGALLPCVSIQEATIMLVPLCNHCKENPEENNENLCWPAFEKIALDKNSKNGLKFSAILFFAVEDPVTGDFDGSVFNRSRMLRDFFANSMPAVTCNHENALDVIKVLALKISACEIDINLVRENLTTLLEKLFTRLD